MTFVTEIPQKSKMSFEEWIKLLGSEFPYNLEKLRGYYDAVFSSEWMPNDFFSLPDPVQKCINENTIWGVSPDKDLAVYMDLIEEMKTNFGFLLDWDRCEDPERWLILEQFPEEVGFKAKRQIAIFCRSNHSDRWGLQWPGIVSGAIHMMRIQHGTDTVHEALERYNSLKTTGDLRALREYVKRFDELEEYPTSWALKLV